MPRQPPEQQPASDLPLFQPRKASRATDPETSHAAAHGVAPVVTDLQRRILENFRTATDGLTAKEIEYLPEYAQYEYSTVRKRVSELHRAGFLRDTTKRREGCVVFELTSNIGHHAPAPAGSVHGVVGEQT